MIERTINLPDGLEPMSEEDLQTIWNKADDARGDQAYLSDDVFDLVNALEAAYAQIDSLQQQLAERDRTIARLSADLDTSVSSQLNMTDKAYRYQKALEEAKTAIQKDLALANGKDEQALLSAFNHINKALGE
ncbi:hypothetical protein UY416_09670 [Paenibacillus polymyxa]|uniref:hypothetical protein n=1 Tax=Paenibacillus polymyxa TaxID=1406 RepID=UPI002AB34E77|nr:hypothetical protein [Paenibacillus polymyxa]MDY8046561.1 hypothetical protein [Paenibacillus polymyxa]